MQSGSANFKRRRLFCLLGAIFTVSAVIRLSGICLDYGRGQEVYRRLNEAVVAEETAGTKARDAGGSKDTNTKGSRADGSGVGQTGTKAGLEPDYRSVKIDFARLKEINEDIIGWLRFDRNGISYPVLKGADNREYLYTLADGTLNDAGSIFMDALCSPDFEDPHTILYGHNRKDGTMFGRLKRYGTDPDYYKDNRFFTVYTPSGCFRYEIFAWYEAGQEDTVYRVGFAADEEFEKFAAELGQRCSADTQTAAGRDDKVLTLSTCSAAGRRFVVHGKRIEGE